MTVAQRPSPSDLNLERVIAEAVPGQIREVQRELAALAASQVSKRAVLARLIDMALLHGIPLCAPTAQLELVPDKSPDTQTPPTLAGVGGGSALRGGA